MLWIVWEKTRESLMGSKEIKPVHPKGNQSWIFIRRTDAEAEAPVLRPPDAKSLTHRKRPWCWEILKAKDEEGGRGWDGWMASLTWWTWVWATFRRMLRIDDPGFLLQADRVAESHMWLSDWTTANVHAASGGYTSWVGWKYCGECHLQRAWVQGVIQAAEKHSQFAYLSTLLDSEPSGGLPWTKLTAWNYLACWVKHLTAKGGWNLTWTFYICFPYSPPYYWLLISPEATPFQGLVEFLVKRVLASLRPVSLQPSVVQERELRWMPWITGGWWHPGEGLCRGWAQVVSGLKQRSEWLGPQASCCVTHDTPRTEGIGGQFNLLNSNLGWFISSRPVENPGFLANLQNWISSQSDRYLGAEAATVALQKWLPCSPRFMVHIFPTFPEKPMTIC